jgi:hypothetical protein
MMKGTLSSSRRDSFPFLAASLVYSDTLFLYFTPSYHSFHSQLSFPFALAINKERRAKQNSPPRLLTMISLWGKFSESQRWDFSGFSAHKFQLCWEQWLSCPTPKDKMRHRPCFFFLFQASNLSKQSLLNPHGKLANTTHSSSPISAGMKSNFKLVNVHVVKWFPIDWEWVGGGTELRGSFAVGPTSEWKPKSLRSQEQV